MTSGEPGTAVGGFQPDTRPSRPESVPMLRRAVLALSCVLALTVPEAAAQRPPPGLFSPADPSTEYVAKVAMADMFTIETAKSALRRSPSEAVRRFAQQVLDEHGWLSAQLHQTAEEMDPQPTLPRKLDRPHKRLLADLNAAPRAEFDRLYIRLQVQANEDVLAEHTKYAVTGPIGGLRGLAETAKPVIQANLKELRSLTPGE